MTIYNIILHYTYISTYLYIHIYIHIFIKKCINKYIFSVNKKNILLHNERQ